MTGPPAPESTFRVGVGNTMGETQPVTPHVIPQVTPQVTTQVTTQVEAILQAALQPRSREELQQAASLENREHFRKHYLLPLLRAGWLERTIPDRPRSRLQRYKTTELGMSALENGKKEAP